MLNRSFLFIFVFRCVSRPLNKFRQPSGTLRELVALYGISHGVREMKIGRGEFEIGSVLHRYEIFHFIYKRRDKFSLYIQFMRVIQKAASCICAAQLIFPRSRVGGYQAT